MTSLEIEKLPEFDDHKFVTFLSDKPSGLRAFIAIHNDNLGPATGGTRMWVYPSETDALRDALNLSRAMTYKCALAGVAYGGSKGVIIGDPHKDKTPALLEAYARAIDNLGNLTTGTDVGLDDSDVAFMRKFSTRILGVTNGDHLSTSSMATLGVFNALLAAAHEYWGGNSIENKIVGVKGLGKTGEELVRLLLEKGARVIAAEIDSSQAKAVSKKYPSIKMVDSQELHLQNLDIFSPCALGNELNPKTVQELNCKVIVGSANNQLSSPEIGDWIHRNGILYIPDYIANAGGLINVVDELEPGGYKKSRVLERVSEIQKTVKKVISRSHKERLASNRVADRMAEEIFKKKVKKPL